MKIIITGGAGFIGSSIATYLKSNNEKWQIICFDNLKRRGSELNLISLQDLGIKFIHGDIRCKEDLEILDDFDLLTQLFKRFFLVPADKKGFYIFGCFQD